MLTKTLGALNMIRHIWNVNIQLRTCFTSLILCRNELCHLFTFYATLTERKASHYAECLHTLILIITLTCMHTSEGAEVFHEEPS